MANVSFNVIAGYSTLAECEEFVVYAQNLLSLIKECPSTRVVEKAATTRMLKESIEKAEEWWLAHGGIESIPEDLR